MATVFRSIDAQVHARLRKWPDRPPGLPMADGTDAWLRGRPGRPESICQPFLKLPGSDRMRTLPDGLWLNFGGTPAEPFVDIFAVEACGTLQNLLDKRSRFAASTHSMLAFCPLPWLLAPVAEGDTMQRWQATTVLAAEPTAPLVLPVRDMRVLYGLKPRHYGTFAASQIPHAHEYFVPMEALTAEDGYRDPLLRELVGRAAISAHFWRGAAGSAVERVADQDGVVTLGAGG
jgi:hypothetical protein